MCGKIHSLPNEAHFYPQKTNFTRRNKPNASKYFSISKPPILLRILETFAPELKLICPDIHHKSIRIENPRGAENKRNPQR